MEDKPAGDNSCMFLLRCWRESDPASGELTWRFSLLETAEEQQRRGFKDLEAAVAFIGAELVRLAE